MRRILDFPVCLCASAFALLLASGCGQSEGERCQINSDCASGLTCVDGMSGNGKCQPNNTVVTQPSDAAAKDDTAVVSGFDVEPTVDAESVLPSDASVSIDTTAVDTVAVDTL